MVETERLLSTFTGVTVTGARVDSKLDDGVTLCFCLAPTPVPIQWKGMFANLSQSTHGSVISLTNPVLHGNDIIWKVVEGDIPNAKQYVTERVRQTNVLFQQMLVDTAPQLIHEAVQGSVAEVERLQRVLDDS